MLATKHACEASSRQGIGFGAGSSCGGQHPPVRYSTSAVSRGLATGAGTLDAPMMMVPSFSTTICLPAASITLASATPLLAAARGRREGQA